MTLLFALACEAPTDTLAARGPHAQADPSSTPSTTPTELGPLQVHLIDVWQGDALLVVAPDGTTMLVDAGDEGEYPGLVAYLRDAGVDHVDYTLVSHLHVDHMGSMDRVLEDHPDVRAAYDGGGTLEGSSIDDYEEAAGPLRTTVAVDDTIDLGPGVVVDVLHSDVGDRDNENNNSVVVRITHGDVTFLLGGDCESFVCERALHPGHIDVYKVHHHGSSDSTAWRLLQEMQPTVALIGVGAGNDYGHPHESTLDLLADIGAQVWRTDEDGDVVVTSDGTSVGVE